MNMKKTIAAVAACAVAVSAMATTVSADANTLTYNLVKSVKTVNAGTITMTATLNHYDVTAQGSNILNLFVEVPQASIGWEADACKFNNTTITLSGRDNAASTALASDLIYSNNIKSANYFNGFDFDNSGSKDKSTLYSYKQEDNAQAYRLGLVIPVGTGVKKALPASNDVNLTITVTTEHNLSTWQTIEAFNKTVTAAATTEAWTGDTRFVVGEVLAPATTKVYNTPAATLIPGYTAGAIRVVTPQFTAFAATTDKVTKYPFRTTVNTSANLAGTPEVINYLENTTDYNYTTNTAGKIGINGDRAYANVKAVINDIIANYNDVTFTFNTATSYVFPVANGGSGAYTANSWDTEAHQLTGSDIWGTSYTREEKVAADGQFMNFSQHLYNLYGNENSTYVGYTTYDWSASNLFAGALVINNNLSMSLSDTESFEYSKTGLSFNWADITDGAQVNTYVTYLSTMKLATSIDWYWDSLTITYDNTEIADAGTGQGVEAEEEEIADEEIADEEIADEEIADEEIADEEIEEEPAEEEAPVEEEAPAENPTTGNAPIALAVIPVALAAAAVVAKKRN